MKRLIKIRVANSVLITGLLGFLSLSFFDDSGTASVGGARGAVIGFLLLVVIFFLGTIYYTRKSGGSWDRVRKNLKHNFLAGISFDWKKKK